ncbi:MAG: hypothetical protein JNK49_11370 [Planctomycetes bacterium]|nr:hypothetical protein [Planctomycetota bacterium]
MPRHLPLLRTLALLVVAHLPSQAPSSPAPSAPVPTRRGTELRELTRAAADQVVAIPTSSQHGLAATPDGVLWALVLRAEQVSADRASKDGSDLEIWTSADRGGHWTHCASAPTAKDHDGALVPYGDGVTLAWTAAAGGGLSNVYTQHYSVAKAQWLGEPVLLTASTGEQDQYFQPDIEATADGTLVVAFGCHRAPQRGPWRSGWSTGLRWRAPGRDTWAEVVQANVSTHGVSGTLAAHGAMVDVVYRTNPGQAILGLRTLHPASGTFAEEQDHPATAALVGSEPIANVAALAIDAQGGRTVLHVLGGDEPGEGRLAVSFAPAGAAGPGAFVTRELCADPPLVGGNANPRHFVLCRGPGNLIHAYFAKAEEGYAALWHCALTEGQPAFAPQRVAEGGADAFVMLSGNRCAATTSTAHLLVLGRPERNPGGVVSVFGSWPAQTTVTAKARTSRPAAGR